MTPYLLSNGHQGDAQAKINDLHEMNERLERELAAERALADRLAETIQSLPAHVKANINPQALAAWKEARHEA